MICTMAIMRCCPESERPSAGFEKLDQELFGGVENQTMRILVRG
jgi:hypothetical protein